MSIVTRFPPSPTGFLHIGGARTALYSWLHARQNKGRFVVRIEDTDRERSTQEAVDAILESMDWLGLDYDEGPYYQTQRFDRYAEIVQQLLGSGHAYHCYCSKERIDALREEQRANGEKPRYDGHCRDAEKPSEGASSVIRFRNPDDGDVVFQDLARGEIRISNKELDDLIIARSDGTPTYNLTVVVDDMDMGITQAIRGDDHINNTPRQINLFRALGAEPPQYAHIPMILGGDGKRLSKRHGAVSVMQYRDDGFLPDALLCYLLRLGWAHGDQELFTRAEMTELFDVTSVHGKAAVFDVDKAQWVNQQFIKESAPQDLVTELAWQMQRQGVDAAALEQGPDMAAVVACLQDRAKTMKEMAEKARFFYEKPTEYNPKAVKKHLKGPVAEILESLISKLTALNSWLPEPLHDLVNAVAEDKEVGMGNVAQPIRIALAGVAATPAIDQTLAVLGRDETIARLGELLQWQQGREQAAS